MIYEMNHILNCRYEIKCICNIHVHCMFNFVHGFHKHLYLEVLRVRIFMVTVCQQLLTSWHRLKVSELVSLI